MEIVLISFYVTANFKTMLKTFLVLDEDWYYFVSTLNNKITIVRRCSAFEGSYSEIAMKLAFAEQAPMSAPVFDFFESNHKRMFKTCELDFELPKTEDNE